MKSNFLKKRWDFLCLITLYKHFFSKNIVYIFDFFYFFIFLFFYMYEYEYEKKKKKKNNSW